MRICMYCEVILLLLSTHMFCVYLIVERQLMDGNKLFYFILLSVWKANWCMFDGRLVIHSPSCSLLFVWISAFTGMSIMHLAAAQPYMTLAWSLLVEQRSLFVVLAPKTCWTGCSLDRPQPHCNCSSLERAGKGWVQANPGCVLLIPVLWSLLGDDHVRFSLQLRL